MLADIVPFDEYVIESILGQLGQKIFYLDWRDDSLKAFDLATLAVSSPAPGVSVFSYEGEYQAATLNGVMLFNGYQAASGYELWVTDGTPEGTSLLKDINPGAGDSYPVGLFEHEGYVYFSAAGDGTNYELWRTDGTAEGTQLFLDLAPGKASNPYPQAVINGKMLVAALGTSSDRSPAGIYSIDLTTKAFERLTSAYPGYYAAALADGSGMIFSAAASGTDRDEVWFTDGSLAGTKRIAEIPVAGASQFMDGFFALGDYVYFTAYDDGGGQSIYRADSNAAVKVFTNVSSPDLVGVIGGSLIIRAVGTDGIERLYVYTDPNYVAPPTVIQNPQNPTTPPAAGGAVVALTPQVTSPPVTAARLGQSFELVGANLRGVLVTIGGKSAFSKINEAGNLEVIVPNLAPGTYDIVLTLGSAKITMSNHLIFGTPTSTAVGEARGWTKRVSDTEIKLYFKNPVGAGKVQLYHNGREIAWVNATSSSDPKLRQAGGSDYLVRTRKLEPGFNTFEIYVDGERVVRRVQSN
jgi:ELWxxDGT repeat protein